MYDAACERGGQSNTTAHGCATGGRDDSTLVTHVKRDTTQGRLAGAVATLPSPWTGTQTGGVGPREYGSRAVVRIGVSGKRVNRAYCRGGRRASTLYKCRADASSRIVLGCTHTRPCAPERPGRPLRRALAGTQRPAPDWPSAEGGLGAAVWGCRLRAARGGDDCPSAVETTVTRWWNGRARCAPRARPHGAGLAMGEPTHHRRRTSIGWWLAISSERGPWCGPHDGCSRPEQRRLVDCRSSFVRLRSGAPIGQRSPGPPRMPTAG